MVNLPSQLPIQIGQGDQFAREMQAPPVVRYTTMISGDFDPSKVAAATNLLLASSAGAIFQFWNAQTQLADLSGLPQTHGAAKLPAMDLRYSRNQQTSQLDMTLYPEALANLEEAIEYREEKHEKGDSPLKIIWGQLIKIDVPFTDWGIYYDYPGGHKTWPSIGWATGAGVGPLLAYAGREALVRKQYFEVKLIKLPRGTTPPDDIETLGGVADNNYTDSPIKHHTTVENTWKWPTQLDTFYTPAIGLARKDVMQGINADMKNPFQDLAPGVNTNTVGGVALSMMYGKVHTHTETTTYPDSGYKIFNDDGTEVFWADYFIAGPDVSDTTDRFWNENEIVGNGGYLFQVAWGSSGMAPASGPPISYATPGYPSQFTWNGLTWFYIGGVADGVFTLTTIGWVQTDRPDSTSDYSNYFPPDPLVDGANYSVVTPPSDGFLWAPAPPIAPDGYAMNYTDPGHLYTGRYHQSFSGVCANHVEYVAPGSGVVETSDTYSERHKYGDIFTDVPGAVAFDDGLTDSEIPPGHGEGRTFPILKDLTWPGSDGVNLGDLKEGDVVMVAADMDDGKIWFGLNGSWKGKPGKYGHAQTFDVSDKDLPWYPVAGGFGEFKGRLCLGVGLTYDPPGGFERAGGNTISFDIPYDIS